MCPAVRRRRSYLRLDGPVGSTSTRAGIPATSGGGRVTGLRIYEWNRFQAIVLGNPLPAGFGIFVTGLGPPTTNDSWLARVILHTNLSADAIMGGTPAINEAAFDALSVVYTICWKDRKSTRLNSSHVEI